MINLKKIKGILLELIWNKKYVLVLFNLFLVVNLTYSQKDIPKNTKDTTDNQIDNSKPNFGIPIKDKEIELPNKYNYITDIQLQILSRSKSREYYNDNNEEKYKKDFEDVEGAKVTWQKKEGDNSIYLVTVPPLKPNHFYRLELSYLSSEGIVALFLMMHDEKNTDWYTSKKEWMQLLKRLSDRNEPFSITYDPSMSELKSFQNSIDSIDLNNLEINEANFVKDYKNDEITEKKKEEIKKNKQEQIVLLDKIAKSEFGILNFEENKKKYNDEDLIKFSKWIKKSHHLLIKKHISLKNSLIL